MQPASGPQHLVALLRIIAIVLGVAIGTQEMMAAFILVPKPLNENVYAELSDIGRGVYGPERDMPIFLIGCASSLMLALWISRRWEARLRDEEAGSDWEMFGPRIAWLGLLALSSMSMSVLVLILSRMRPDFAQATVFQITLLVVPGVATLILALVGRRPGRLSRWVSVPLRRIGPANTDPSATGTGRFRGPAPFLDAAWGLLMVVVVVSLAYVSSYRELAGRVFERDSFHHWDFFVVGPMIAHRAGAALGTEVYSQYGVGYPLLASWLMRPDSFSYGKLIHFATMYGCAYFLAMAAGLRIVLRSRLWSTCGVHVALLFQYFHGVGARPTIWTYPSASILRYAMDVWFFLALVVHCRTGNRLSLLGAGAMVGVSLLLVLDSGIYLLAAFVAYLACRIILGRAAGGMQEISSCEGLVAAAQALATAAVTFLCGLALASRGSLFRRDFWHGYLEPIVNYSSGVSSLPISTGPQLKWLVAFSLITIVYLSFVAALLDGLIRRSVGPLRLLGGCLAAYGLGTLLQFVNRSAYQNLFHGIIPFCVLTVGLLAEAGRRIGERAKTSRARLAAFLIPCATLVLVSFGYMINPVVRQYPSLLGRLFAVPEARGLSPLKDVRGVAPDKEGFVRACRAITKRVAEFKAMGRSVAVVDWSDSMFYAASGVAPADRYCPLLPALLMKKQIADAKARFADRSFDYVVMLEKEQSGQRCADAYEAFRAVVDRNYALQERIGEYGIWRIRGPGLEKQREIGRVIAKDRIQQ
jgi:hypothetical protein